MKYSACSAHALASIVRPHLSSAPHRIFIANRAFLTRPRSHLFASIAPDLIKELEPSKLNTGASQNAFGALGLHKQKTREFGLRKRRGALEPNGEADVVSTIQRSRRQDLMEAESLPLSYSQQALLNILKHGENVYFTGKAGTGKTQVLKSFVGWLERNRKKYGVTAPTGVAAAHLSGQTIHGFFGITPDTAHDLNLILRNTNKQQYLRDRLESLQILVIDEVSMLSPHFMTTISDILRHVRKRPDQPFGGVQLVLSGDFHQLPPVIDAYARKRAAGSVFAQYERLEGSFPGLSAQVAERVKAEREKRMQWKTIDENGDMDKTYAFESYAWKSLMRSQMRMIELLEVFRQTDPAFLRILDETRSGCLTEESRKLLFERVRAPPDNERPTLLTGLRFIASRENEKRLSKLSGHTENYGASDHAYIAHESMLEENDPEMHATLPAIPAKLLRRYFGRMQAESHLSLKKGAQVLLARNMSVSVGLVNGLRGTVVDFVSRTDELSGQSKLVPVVQFKGVQDQVLLPPVRFMNSVPLSVVMQQAEESHDTTLLKVIEQIIGAHGNPNDRRVILVRQQVPLKLGYGITVHKSQGMTLDSVEIDLKRQFAPGQAYVALSRCRSLEGLYLRSLEGIGARGSFLMMGSGNQAVAAVDTRVKDFYDTFEDIQEGGKLLWREAVHNKHDH